MLNRILIAGRMGKDPELRRTQTGTAVASFPIACDRDFKDKQTGEKATDWVDIVVWRSTAEYVTRYGAKGRTVVVDGRLQMRDWTDKEGNKRRTAEVVAESIYFADGRREENTSASSHATAVYGVPDTSDGFSELSDDDGKLPF